MAVIIRLIIGEAHHMRWMRFIPYHRIVQEYWRKFVKLQLLPKRILMHINMQKNIKSNSL